MGIAIDPDLDHDGVCAAASCALNATDTCRYAWSPDNDPAICADLGAGLIVTRRGTNVSLHLEGRLETSTTTQPGTDFDHASAAITIGATTEPSMPRPFVGRVEAARAMRRALAADEQLPWPLAKPQSGLLHNLASGAALDNTQQADADGDSLGDACDP